LHGADHIGAGTHCSITLRHRGHYRRAAIALDLYSEDEEPWDTERLVRADMLAQQVARVMALCIRISEQTVMSDDLTAAVASRWTIDQAIGVVMAQNRCSAEEGITGSAPSAGQFRPRTEI